MHSYGIKANVDGAQHKISSHLQSDFVGRIFTESPKFLQIEADKKCNHVGKCSRHNYVHFQDAMKNKQQNQISKS